MDGKGVAVGKISFGRIGQSSVCGTTIDAAAIDPGFHGRTSVVPDCFPDRTKALSSERTTCQGLPYTQILANPVMQPHDQ